ncbi:hypothetical protein FO519_004076 [Halicephalobus sp. NKZ332]|nr:hypothetical protein FO519_004076 [Halicephalobus sp. NKZ332]
MIPFYLLIAFTPALFYICLLLFSSLDERLYPRLYPVKPICTSSSCVRCSKNLTLLSRANKFFNDVFGGSYQHQRVRRALEKARDQDETLLFQIPELESRPIWTPDDSDKIISKDIAKLEASFATIKLAGLKFLSKNPSMWMKNQEANGSCWFVFPLLNQGQWMDQHCHEDPELMEVLHSLDSVMHGCAFGNIFFSMLPAKSTIQVHRGPTNIRLRCHLGLEVPEDGNSCFLMVDDNKVTWEEGKCFVFDDSRP